VGQIYRVTGHRPLEKGYDICDEYLHVVSNTVHKVRRSVHKYDLIRPRENPHSHCPEFEVLLSSLSYSFQSLTFLVLAVDGRPRDC
jgi:hypothetical protein